MEEKDVRRVSFMKLQAMYDAVLEDVLLASGPAGGTTTHVEPHPSLAGWIADLSHIDGTILGAHIPFATRQAALDAEERWLKIHLRI